MVAQTGCDGVMIGRMAPANPWIFRQIEQYVSRLGTSDKNAHVGADALVRLKNAHVGADALVRPAAPHSTGSEQLPSPDEGVRGYVISGVAGGSAYDVPTEADRYQMIRTYFQMLLEEEIHGAEGKMKQFASWFTHGIPGGATLRKAIYEAKDGKEILDSVEVFFESRLINAEV
jgi:tRNA-dihydrouridine synthase